MISVEPKHKTRTGLHRANIHRATSASPKLKSVPMNRSLLFVTQPGAKNRLSFPQSFALEVATKVNFRVGNLKVAGGAII